MPTRLQHEADMDTPPSAATTQAMTTSLGMNMDGAHTALATARLLEYARGAHLALPSHTTLEIIENPLFTAVPGAAYYAYGLLLWQGEYIPMIDFDTLHRAYQSAHRITAPRYALIVAYQTAPQTPLAYGAIALAGLPQTVQVRDADYCDLPTDCDLWPLLALSCFQHKGHVVPILDTSRLFCKHHG